jgi:hypothetical protein
MVLANLPSRIEAGIEAYMAEHPQAPPPSQAEIVAAVLAELAKNPPQDGRDGQDGEDGPQGPPGDSCEPGEVRETWVYPDGRVGSRCVRQQ